MNRKEFTIGLGAGILIASTLSLAGYLQTLSKWGQEPHNEPVAEIITANAGEDASKKSETAQNTGIVPLEEENPISGQAAEVPEVSDTLPPDTPDEDIEAAIPAAEKPEENIEAKEPEEPTEAVSAHEETPAQAAQAQPVQQPTPQPAQEQPAQQPEPQPAQAQPEQQPAQPAQLPQQPQEQPVKQSEPPPEPAPVQQSEPPPEPAPVQQASTVTVNISGESSHDDIAAEMSSKGLVSDADEFVNYLNKIGLYIKYKPGTHEIDKGASYDEIIEEIMEQ